MIYPSEILPTRGRKHIACDISTLYLVRTFPSTLIEIWNDDCNQISQKCICDPTANIIDLSTSLFGVFTVEHTHLTIMKQSSGELCEYCEPDYPARTPVYSIDFEVDQSKRCWFVLIGNIDYYEVSYNFGDQLDTQYQALCRIIHTPTKWNFWHYSVRWYLSDRDYYLEDLTDFRLKDKITKRLKSRARAMLANFAGLRTPTSDQLPESCYNTYGL